MSEIKGYVVAVDFDGDRDFIWRVSSGCFTGCSPERRTLFTTLPEAIEASRMPKSPPATVTIFALHADGTETSLPTYEEALAELAAADDTYAAGAAAAAKGAITAAREVIAARDAAWARLVKADGAIWLAMVREEDRRPAMEQRDAAKQALRNLGVDVDALLSE